jgi:hypothetical protein
MRPFRVKFKPEESRIITKRQIYRNGVGRVEKQKVFLRTDVNYLTNMAEFEARQMMRGLYPNFALSVGEMAERLKRGYPREKVLRTDIELLYDGEEARVDPEKVNASFSNKLQKFLFRPIKAKESGGKKAKKGGSSTEAEMDFLGKQLVALKRKREEEEESNSNEKKDMDISSESENEKEEGKSRASSNSWRAQDKTDTQSVVSDLDELGLGGGGVPLSGYMRRNLSMSEAIQEKGFETKLGVIHSKSSVSYTPRKTSFKVQSTGEYLREALKGETTFDPLAFTMTSEAREGEEAREKTLSVDFVVAQTPQPIRGRSQFCPL